MQKYNPLEKEWIAVLKGGDTQRIVSTLFEIRNSGSVTILPVLFGMIHKRTDPQVRNEILTLVGEIKTQEAVPIIAASLEKLDFGDYLAAFVAACWLSGLDFSSHLRVFAGLFIEADYRTALEAFTVIEESLPNASDTELHACSHYLMDAECMVSDEKLPLFRELKKVVGQY